MTLPTGTTGTIQLSGTAESSAASTVSDEAVISGGTATATLTVTALNGDTRVYTVNFAVEQTEQTPGTGTQQPGTQTPLGAQTPSGTVNQPGTQTSAGNVQSGAAQGMTPATGDETNVPAALFAMAGAAAVLAVIYKRRLTKNS